MDEDLAFAPATELVELIATKEVSPVELTQMYLDRIDRLDSQLNSYLTLIHDEAMDAATAAEEAVVRGDRLGSLHGLPIADKDLHMTKGIRSMGGSLIFKNRVPEEDSTVAARWRGAGAVILGKTNTPEFGMLGASENRLGEECRNPWNPERTSGGSSGGSASAVAAGLCALATGGDGGGSIRIPASFCGVYGIKPTQGRVSSFASSDGPLLANLLGQNASLTRTVRDSAMFLRIIAGHDRKDPSSLRDKPDDYVAATERDITGLRVAWSPDYGYAAVDPEVVEVCARATQVFEELGCSVEESDIALESPFDTWWTIYSTSGYANYGRLLEEHADDLTWYARMSIEGGRDVTGVTYAKALGQRARMQAQFGDVLERYDLLLSPTMAVTAFPVGRYPDVIDGKDPYPSPSWGFLPFTHPINTIGYPAASVPCGFSSDGMPIGLHIVGRPGDEATILAASAAFERARPWIQHRPPVS